MGPISMRKIEMFVILGLGAVCEDSTAHPSDMVELFRSLAEDGHAAWQFELGTLYHLHYKDYNIAQNIPEAEKWYTEAAEDGHAAAQNNLGTIYFNRRKYKKALEWYKKAASKDDKFEYNRGRMYFMGIGVEENRVKGVRLMIKAAQGDETMAQYVLGDLMNQNKRYEEAYYWLALAQKKEKELERDGVNIDSLSTLLDELEILIDHKKINELQELTGDSWKPKQSDGGGSGFRIKEDLVLTNEHVINSCNEVRVGTFHYRVKVVEEDSLVDLALLKILSDLPSEKHRPSAPFKSESSSLQLGEDAATFGYPLPGGLSFEGNFTIGNVSSLEGRPTDITPSDSFQFTAPIQPGNSGGPVLDVAGNVVGVVANVEIYAQVESIGTDIIVINRDQNINFAVSLKAIRKFLKDAGVEPDSVSSSDTRKEWTDIARDAQKFTVPVWCFTDKP